MTTELSTQLAPQITFSKNSNRTYTMMLGDQCVGTARKVDGGFQLARYNYRALSGWAWQFVVPATPSGRCTP